MTLCVQLSIYMYVCYGNILVVEVSFVDMCHQCLDFFAE